MIYSASRRTDMVAFHPDAIVERVSRARRLEAIVFWTKDPRNLVRHAGLKAVVTRVPAVVQLTVTGLAGSRWEERTPRLEDFLPDLRELAAMLPSGAVLWRFDPIFPFPDLYERFRHVKDGLESVLGRLAGVTVSYPDPYRHAVHRAARAGFEWPTASPPKKREIVRRLAEFFHLDAIGREVDDGPGIRPIRLCCEPELLDLPCVRQARCIDGHLFQDLYGLPLGELSKDSGQRVACGCVKSTDIGSYAMHCPHRCLYCYANPDGERKD